jgi:hypothetical protein
VYRPLKYSLISKPPHFFDIVSEKLKNTGYKAVQILQFLHVYSLWTMTIKFLLHSFLQEEYECLGPIPGVDPQFLTPDAFTSLPVGYLLGPDVARGPNTDFEPVDTEPKSTKISTTKKSKKATTTGGVSSGPAEIRVNEGGIKGPTQLMVQDIEGAGGEMERGVVAIKPPAELFTSPQMHPLHIFVSTII